MGVSLESVGHAAVVTLRWTDRRNALGPSEAREVAEAIREAATSGAHGIVLTGEGAFCAGGDLKAFADISAEDQLPPQTRQKLGWGLFLGFLVVQIEPSYTDICMLKICTQVVDNH